MLQLKLAFGIVNTLHLLESQSLLKSATLTNALCEWMFVALAGRAEFHTNMLGHRSSICQIWHLREEEFVEVKVSAKLAKNCKGNLNSHQSPVGLKASFI